MDITLKLNLAEAAARAALRALIDAAEEESKRADAAAESAAAAGKGKGKPKTSPKTEPAPAAAAKPEAGAPTISDETRKQIIEALIKRIPDKDEAQQKLVALLDGLEVSGGLRALQASRAIPMLRWAETGTYEEDAGQDEPPF